MKVTSQVGARATGVLLLSVVLLSGALSACGSGGGGGVRAAGSTIDDLVRSAPVAGDDASRLRSRLNELHGGTTVADDLAEQFGARRGVVGDIMDAVDPAIGLACDGFDAGSTTVGPVAGQYQVDAQRHLDRMWADVNGGVLALSIRSACAVYDVMNSGL